MKKRIKKILKDKPMLKLSDLALLGLVLIHSIDNITTWVLLCCTVSRIEKIGMVLYLIGSNIYICLILKKFGKVWH